MTPTIYKLKVRVFGKACKIYVKNSNGRGDELLSMARAELNRLESKFSSSSRHGVIGKLNHSAGTAQTIHLDTEARSLLVYASRLWEKSNHLFDPSITVLVDPHRSLDFTSISTLSLSKRVSQTGWSKLKFTTDEARITDRGMTINLDTCVRPYAVDSIRRIFLGEGVTSALIDLDDDIATIGKQDDGANWLVGVRHPVGSSTAIATLKLVNGGYARRGNFQNRISINGENFGRALSPVDGQPIPGLLSIGVMADTCLAAFGAAAVAQVKTEQASLKWLKSLGLPWMAIDRKLQCHGLLSPKK